MQKHLNSAKDIFQLTLAKLNLSLNQREFCLNSKVTDNITYDHAKQIAEMANLKNFSLTAWEEATKLIEAHNQHQVKVVPLGSEYYPPSLELIDNPPKIIFAKGNFDLLLNNPGVSIVGSRSATKFGLKAAEKIAAHFAERGLVIVSGLALGIDSAAHRSCLVNRGSTIAVLAHGLHRVYPPDNLSLSASILDNGGLLLSEYPIGMEPKKNFFVLRNRIQVGISSFSIVVEAKKKSGTMSHADYCLKAKHPIYVVLPQNAALTSSFDGNLWLYQERGALPLRSHLDYPNFRSHTIVESRQL